VPNTRERKTIMVMPEPDWEDGWVNGDALVLAMCKAEVELYRHDG
jgi:hypothetical protein